MANCEPIIAGKLTLENRIKSIEKWNMVEVLFIARKYLDAHELAGGMDDCGHCSQYNDIETQLCSEKCPLYDDQEESYCHYIVNSAIARLEHTDDMKTQLDNNLISDGTFDTHVADVLIHIMKVRMMVRDDSWVKTIQMVDNCKCPNGT